MEKLTVFTGHYPIKDCHNRRKRMTPARWGPPGMGGPRHGSPEMSFDFCEKKLNEQKDPCLDAKMSQISLRCTKCRKNQLACVEKNDMLMSRKDNIRKTEEKSPSLTLAESWAARRESYAESCFNLVALMKILRNFSNFKSSLEK